MYKTLFESDLSEFFFAETCSENEEQIVYARYGEGVVTNLPQEPKALSGKARWLSLGAAVTAMFFVTQTQTNMFSALSLQRNERSRIEATSAPPGILERQAKAIVDKLSESRSYFAINQQQLADLLGLSLSTVTKLEADRHLPSPATIRKISRGLELFGYLKSVLGDRKYTIREMFHSRYPVFGGMNAIEFAKDLGEDGLDEVYAVFKRQYG